MRLKELYDAVLWLAEALRDRSPSVVLPQYISSAMVRSNMAQASPCAMVIRAAARDDGRPLARKAG
jgi:hypothetical protein